MNRQLNQQQSSALNELSSIVLNLIRSPPSPFELFMDHRAPAISSPASSPAPMPRRRSLRAESITPAGFASLMLGISMALMFCGSLTFFIGFMLMPWVIGLFMVLYFVGFISTLSFLGRSIICYATSVTLKTSSPARPLPRKDIQEWKLL